MARKRQRYLAQALKYSWPHSWEVCAEKRFSTMRAAENYCWQYLNRHPIETTEGNYHRDVSRGPDVCIRDLGRCRDGKILASGEWSEMEAPVNIVPSVADRGVW